MHERTIVRNSELGWGSLIDVITVTTLVGVHVDNTTTVAHTVDMRPGAYRAAMQQLFIVGVVASW